MALIVCPECGKNFSDRAPACPECGCPTADIVGQGSKVSAGQVTVANNAFDDGRYEEAYQLFTQLYAQDQSDPQIMVRLALATVAKDCFSDGIPNSTMDLLGKGFALAKSSAPSQDDFVTQMTAYVTEIQTVMEKVSAALLTQLSATVEQTAPMRSTGAMVADALLSPVGSANRNLYEDRRTAASNDKLLRNAGNNMLAVIETQHAFGSRLLELVADVLSGQVKDDDPLYSALEYFVHTMDDVKNCARLSTSGTLPKDMSGLCYGEEATILELENVSSQVYVDGKACIKGFFGPRGHLILTNYKVYYTDYKERNSFEKPLDDLICVQSSDRGLKTVELVFPNNTSVHIFADDVDQCITKIKNALKLP